MKNPEINQLIEKLSSPDWQVNRQASQQLMQAGEVAVPALIAALNSSDLRRTIAVISALEVIEDARAVDPLVALMQTNRAELAQPLVFALGRLGIPAVPALAALIQDAAIPVDVRVQAASALARTDAIEAVAPLWRALADDEPHVRETAANSLAWIRQPDTFDAVKAALTHDDIEVRFEAVQGLEWRGYYLEGIPEGSRIESWVNVVAVPLLLFALEDTDVDVRTSAAAGLGWLYNEEAVWALVNGLQDEAPGVRQNAAASLGEIARTDTVPALIEALNDGNEEAAVALDVIATLHPESEYTPAAAAAVKAFGADNP